MSLTEHGSINNFQLSLQDFLLIWNVHKPTVFAEPYYLNIRIEFSVTGYTSTLW